ncbi:MAG: SGNH/GDSL hydrolase family protein [Armatimonas sp.]
MEDTAKKKPKNALVNGDFAAGQKGWRTEGTVRFLPATSTAPKPRVQLGPGASAIRQRHRINGLQTLWFGVNLTADTGRVRVACYDKNNHLLLEASGDGSTYPTIYLKTHAYTAYVILSIEKKPGTAQPLYADSALLQDDSLTRKSHPAQCNLDTYLQPFWKGNKVVDETVLLLSEHGEAAGGKLMLPPQQILSVQDYAHKTKFMAGRDYALAGNTITALPGSQIPRMRSSDFEQGDLKWYSLAGKPIVVTYTHQSAWQGPVPSYQADKLPGTLRKLTNRTPLTIVAYGDSITHGIGTSGEAQIPPYMPTWAELFVHGLKRHYKHRHIQLYNTALGGMTSEWGEDNATAAVASLSPDLVLIAFGMNDFWGMQPVSFLGHIKEILRRVRIRKPAAEFVLISSMRFDPAYAKDPQYRTRMVGYTAALHSLVSTGICLLDMDAISGALAEAKKPKDLISDPLHPNDFLARWYAQGLVALLCRD